jgi:pantoate--beta-alanine ligase
MALRVLDTVAEFRDARQQVKGALGFVPTLGYLHEGHLALVRRARAEIDAVAVSIFVYVAQFGPGEDYASYPRDLERDLALLRREAVDLAFIPSVQEIYPPGFDTWVEVGDLGRRLEGEHRPGHFRGVATVVSVLFNIVRPGRACFGQKDGQQVAVIRRLVTDLNMGIQVVVVPTVREPDGLAMSSRNVLLTPEQRQAAPVVYRALSSAHKLWHAGERRGGRLRTEVRGLLEAVSQISGVDYVSVAHASTLEEMETVAEGAMVSVAVRMGRTRLIDNVLLT